jgi:hypothetical protein
MVTVLHFKRNNCLQIEVWCSEISTLKGEGQGSLIKETFAKVVGMCQDSEKLNW